MTGQPAVANETLVADIARVAQRIGRKALSRAEYLQHGSYSEYQIYDGGRTWEDLCRLAGITTKRSVPVPDDVYLDRLESAVQKLGRLPKVSERKQFGLNFSKRRYPTLQAFVERAVELGRLPAIHGKAQPRKQPDSPHIPREPGPPLSAPVPDARPVTPIPIQTKRRKWERTGIDGFPYAPQDELGVVALFGILCAAGKIGWQILELRGGKGIDITCFDHVMSRELRVELKHTLSRASWNHRFEDVDYVVCWVNRWPQFPKPVIALSELLHELESEA